jgi:ubiquinone/menaquinone biosynthesis C-methylase UbiE
VSGSSLRFDRAVEYYDRTRRISEGASRRQTELLAAELDDRRTLEIGVGTGLVALPLAAAGVDVVGLDLSEPMLRRLEEKAGGRPFPLVIGDATALPFREDAFGAALVRHVLHLVPDWERLLDELVRVLRSDGTVFVATGDIPRVWREVTQRFIEQVGRPSFVRGVDVRDLERLDRAFAERGATARALPSFPERVETSLATFLDQMAEGLHSWTWDLDDDLRRAAVADVRRWAEERFGTLDPPEAREVTIEWRAYDLG